MNIASIMGSLSIHGTDGGMSYKPFADDASKTAVNVFSIHLAAALSGIAMKVNSAHAGWVRTNMGGPHAPLSPEEGVKTAGRGSPR